MLIFLLNGMVRNEVVGYASKPGVAVVLGLSPPRCRSQPQPYPRLLEPKRRSATLAADAVPASLYA
jgi:hypothetical protein